MTNNEKITILGYELEFLPIEDFKEFYKTCTQFNTFSEKAFLKASGIPPGYYQEQPEKTQEDLLNNKEEILPEKLAGKIIVILRKNNLILNCCRIDADDLDHLQNRLKIGNEDKFISIRDHVEEGYLTLFIKNSRGLYKGKYNLGMFLDFPIMLNKLPEMHLGYYYVPKDETEEQKCLYVSSKVMDFSEYTDIDIAIEESLHDLEDLENRNIITKLKEDRLLRDYDETLIKLADTKTIPKGYIKKISKYISKNDIQITSKMSFVDIILKYDVNFNKYKTLKRLRQVTPTLENILEESK